MKQHSVLAFLVVSLLSTQSFSADSPKPRAGEPAALPPAPPLTEDSRPQPGVPKGEVLGPFLWKSEIFPGTVRNYWLYVPRQYDAAKPTCVFVVQDGLGRANAWHLPVMLDNLIHKKEVPVQIGLFVQPGTVPASGKHATSRPNRSFEYDSLGDRYARFLVEELLPEVAKTYNLSRDPNDRALAGGSSGGICSFNAAWERPDQFRRVVSSIGTFTGLRGSHDLQLQIRKCEPRPIRVFLEDGTNDANGFSGSFFLANQQMLASLQYANYDVRHHWDDGGHDARNSAVIMPDALRFIWHGYPQPVAVPEAPKARINILIAGERWQEVSSGHASAAGLAVNQNGEVFFSDSGRGEVHRIAVDGTVTLFAKDVPGISGLAFGPDDRLYACESDRRRIVRFTDDGRQETVVDNVSCNSLVILAIGVGYFTTPADQQVWSFTPDGRKQVVDTGIERPSALAVSPDQTWLTVADSIGRYTWSFQIQPDGTLSAKQQYGWLQLPDDGARSGATGMTVDSSRNVYVCTNAGLQVLDPEGRVNLILDKPQRGPLANVVFGGAELETLYATAGDKVFKRKLTAKGVLPFRPSVPAADARLSP